MLFFGFASLLESVDIISFVFVLSIKIKVIYLYLLLFKLLLHRRYHIEVTPERSKCKRHLTLSFCNKPMNQKYQIIKTNGCWNDRYIQVFVGVVHRRRDVKMGYDRGTRAGPSDVFLFILILQPEKERFEVSQERCHA